MTEKKQDQAKTEQQQTQAIELEETQLEQAQGGAIYMKVDGADGNGTKGIKDGLSH